jgi:hypothetical protein
MYRRSYNSDANSLPITSQTGDFYTYDTRPTQLPKLDARHWFRISFSKAARTLRPGRVWRIQ